MDPFYLGLFYIVSSVYLLVMPFNINTGNQLSFVIYKIVPVLIGLVWAWLTFTHFGFIVQIPVG